MDARKLEQRIGRVDRMGQTSDSVSVLNLMHAGTIDERIYRRLFERLKVCERALGGFEKVLGEEIAKLVPLLLLGRLSEEEQERRLDQSRQAAETRRLQEEELEREAAALVAHGDRILRTIHEARSEGRWIGPDELAEFVRDGVERLFPGSSLERRAEGGDLYGLRMSPACRADFSRFLDREKLRDGRRLASSADMRVRFGKWPEPWIEP